MNPRFLTRISLLCWSGLALASSHREAPMITTTPKVDATDFYLFNSYEPGRQDYVTLVANYIPLQDSYAGPNYFMMDTNARYRINIDTNGDIQPDVIFTFQFRQEKKKFALNIGPQGNTKSVEIPLITAGPVSASNTNNVNVIEWYSMQVWSDVHGDGWAQDVGTGGKWFRKPVDNIGMKTFPNYPEYADRHIYEVNIPDCNQTARIFVGQRKESFAVALGETFDLVNLNPLAAPDSKKNSLEYKNVTSFVLEVPKTCIQNGQNKVISGWTTAEVWEYAKDKHGNVAQRWVQKSRLGNPLVNELIIGLDDKDAFNASQPSGDGQFLKYVTNPTLPALLEQLFGVKAPTTFPRNDLVAVFLTGVPDLNKTKGTGEVMRLNMSTPVVPMDKQNNLGVIAGDSAGYPNGRRPGDDVVDISLRVAMGKLLLEKDAPGGQLPLTDGAYVDAKMFQNRFPYLNNPIPGTGAAGY